MRSIFLSYSFRNEHHPLLVAIRTIIEAVGFRVVDGKILNTNHVGPGVTKKLQNCYGAVCVLTKEAYASGWVDVEFWQAVGANVKVCILCDESLTLSNAYQGRVKYLFKEGNELVAIEKLAGTIGLWKQEAGNSTRALLLPTELLDEAIRHEPTCEYRCINDIDATETEWQKAKLVPYVAGVQAILPTVPANHSIKIRLRSNHSRPLSSDYTPQQIILQLR